MPLAPLGVHWWVPCMLVGAVHASGCCPCQWVPYCGPHGRPTGFAKEVHRGHRGGTGTETGGTSGASGTRGCTPVSAAHEMGAMLHIGNPVAIPQASQAHAAWAQSGTGVHSLRPPGAQPAEPCSARAEGTGWQLLLAPFLPTPLPRSPGTQQPGQGPDRSFERIFSYSTLPLA